MFFSQAIHIFFSSEKNVNRLRKMPQHNQVCIRLVYSEMKFSTKKTPRSSSAVKGLSPPGKNKKIPRLSCKTKLRGILSSEIPMGFKPEGKTCPYLSPK